jgi:hypothetical protein
VVAEDQRRTTQRERAGKQHAPEEDTMRHCRSRSMCPRDYIAGRYWLPDQQAARSEAPRIRR